MEKKDRRVWRALIMVSQISISILVPIFLCMGAGWWLDNKFHTQIWFLVLLLLGIGAAFRNVYMLTRNFYAEDMKKEQEKLKYIEDLKQYHSKHPEEDPLDGLKKRKRHYPDPKQKKGNGE